jgi:ubiquinone/menaquinone biosynthesis C-methylase UbiE
VSTTKSAVRDYWQAQPCGTTLTDIPAGSAEFFAEVERQRYAAEPFIHNFAAFSSWRSARVLEIGTGIGSDFLNFVRGGAAAVGVDLTPAAVSLVRRRLALEHLSASTLVADAESLPFADGSFDLVYSWGVLHHTPDTARAIGEVSRVIKSGGEARVMLYARHSWVAVGLWLRHALARGHPRRSLTDVLDRDLESPGTKAFTTAEIRKLFSAFSDVTIQNYVTPYDRRVAGPLATLIPAGFFVGIRASKY